MLITEGGPDVPEVRQNNGTIRRLTSASLDQPLYPWMDVAPDGRAFYSGPDNRMASLTQWHGPMADARTARRHGPRLRKSRDVRHREDPRFRGRQLAEERQDDQPERCEPSGVDNGVDGNGPTTAQPHGAGRRHGPCYRRELFRRRPCRREQRRLHRRALEPCDRDLAHAGRGAGTRQYHSTALLLPDGRVLSSGGGICGACDSQGYLAKNAEVFSPPYLFQKDGSGALATRPTITSAPGSVAYNTAFTINTPAASSIGKVALVRLGAVTHSVNMEQRYVPLSFTAGSGNLTATAPLNANIAPPGYYMLFVIGTDGVPSVANMVRVESDTSPPAPPSLTDTDPDSPANDNNPEVKGSAEAGSKSGSTRPPTARGRRSLPAPPPPSAAPGSRPRSPAIRPQTFGPRRPTAPRTPRVAQAPWPTPRIPRRPQRRVSPTPTPTPRPTTKTRRSRARRRPARPSASTRLLVVPARRWQPVAPPPSTAPESRPRSPAIRPQTSAPPLPTAPRTPRVARALWPTPRTRLLRPLRRSPTPTPTPRPTTTTPRSRARPRPARPSGSIRPPTARGRRWQPAAPPPSTAPGSRPRSPAIRRRTSAPPPLTPSTTFRRARGPSRTPRTRPRPRPRSTPAPRARPTTRRRASASRPPAEPRATNAASTPLRSAHARGPAPLTPRRRSSQTEPTSSRSAQPTPPRTPT